MSAFGPNIANEIAAILQSNFVEGCCVVSAVTAVFYDQLSMLVQEVDFIWGRKPSSVTMLYHLNRWMIGIWAILQLIPSPTTLTRCARLDGLETTVNVLLVVIWAVFTAIREYAVSGGNRWLAALVCLLSVVPAGTNGYVNFGGTLRQMADFPVIGTECISTSTLPNSTVTKLTITSSSCTVAADLIILLTTWLNTYGMRRTAGRYSIKTPLVTMLLRDGTMYFIILLTLNTINIVGWVTNVFVYASSEFTQPVSSIIISHFLLNLRQAARGSEGNTRDDQHPSGLSSHHSTLRFASFVDNMGEQLSHGSDSLESDTIRSNEEGCIISVVKSSRLDGTPALSSNLNRGSELEAVNFAEVIELGPLYADREGA